MNFLSTAKAAAAKFSDDTEIKYGAPPVEDSVVYEVPEGWIHLGERNGKPWYRTTPAVAVPKAKVNPVRAILDALPREVGEHVENGVCPSGTSTTRSASGVMAKVY